MTGRNYPEFISACLAVALLSSCGGSPPTRVSDPHGPDGVIPPLLVPHLLVPNDPYSGCPERSERATPPVPYAGEGDLYVVSPVRPIAGGQRTTKAVLLCDGRILAVHGGDGITPLPISLFDPVSGLWEEGRGFSLLTGFDVTRLLNGQVLVTGSFGESDDFAWLFDSEQESWRPVEDSPAPRRFHTATRLLDGRVLVVGGNSETSWAYDPVEEEWDELEPLSRRQRHTATLLPTGRVLIVGGTTVVGSSEFVTVSAGVYDPLNDSWNEEVSPSTGRFQHTSTLLSNGTVLVAGGTDTFELFGALNSYEIFDSASETWIEEGRLRWSRREHVALLRRDGKVLLFGGGSGITELFDPTTLTTETGAMTGGPQCQAGAIIYPDGQLLYVGGNSCECDDTGPCRDNTQVGFLLPRREPPATNPTATNIEEASPFQSVNELNESLSTTDLTGFVRLWGGAPIYSQPEEASQQRADSRTSLPGAVYSVGQTTPYRVITDLGDFVEVESLNSVEVSNHCQSGSDFPFDELRLRFFVRRRDLAAVVTEPIEFVFDDTTSIEIGGGVTIVPGTGAGRYRINAGGFDTEVELESGAISLSYSAVGLPEVGNPNGLILSEVAMIRFGGEEWGLARDLPSELRRLVDSRIEAGSALVSMSNRCAHINAITDASMITEETEQGGEGVSIGRSYPGRPELYRIAEGSLIRWSTDEEAGSVVAPHYTAQLPEVTGELVCFDRGGLQLCHRPEEVEALRTVSTIDTGPIGITPEQEWGHSRDLRRRIGVGEGELLACYEAELVRAIIHRLEATLEFMVQTDGRVTDVSVPDASQGELEMLTCLEETIADWSFSSDRDEAVQILLPLTFQVFGLE